MMLAAVALSSGVGLLVKHANLTYGWTLGGVSAMSVFSFLYLLFDRVLWRWRWARRFLLVPDLTGTWRCDGKTLFKDGVVHDADWSGTMTIRQSWSRIRIVLTTGKSSSQSIAASVFQEAGSGFRLIYHYDNKPGLGERELARHCGLCNLLFNENLDSASGEYFTDKDRMTAGTMKLTRGGSDNAATGSA
ncbi:MAG: hypothetical protein IPM33_00245 [Phycisphaerales bacterium]|nr:hypothetical protein [Phycisphaerales bacterium]